MKITKIKVYQVDLVVKVGQTVYIIIIIDMINKLTHRAICDILKEYSVKGAVLNKKKRFTKSKLRERFIGLIYMKNVFLFKSQSAELKLIPKQNPPGGGGTHIYLGGRDVRRERPPFFTQKFAIFSLLHVQI